MTTITASIYKETRDIKTGLKVTQVNGINQIREIVPESLFALSAPLVEGMRIVSVNNVQCDGRSPADVAQLVREAQGTVVLVVEGNGDSSVPPPHLYDLGGVTAGTPPAIATVVSATVVKNPPPTAPIITATATNTAVTSVATSTNMGVNRPPPNLPSGGTWGKAKYFGDTSCLFTFLMCICCFPFCCYIACCPQDEKDAYRVNGRVYDASGTYLGSPTDTKFVPSRQRAY